MKKLLVLLLVLGMTSAASATLSVVQTGFPPSDLTVNIGGPGSPLNDGILEGDMYLVISSDGALSGYALTLAAPADSGYGGPTSDLGGMGTPAGFTGQYWVLADLGNPYPISDAVMTVIGGAVGDYVAIGWFNEGGEHGIIETIQLVPEPMTVALLGLGGLMMLRRRK